MNLQFIQIQAVKALAGRGLKTYFESPAAFVALFVFYLLAGYLFAAPLFLIGQASLRGMTEYVPLLLSFLTPALTMGLVSEELRSGTFESLATLPLEDADIVLGKYLGFAAFHLIAISGLLFFPGALALLVQPPAGLDWGESLGILGGFILLGLMNGAAGLFASSLTKNQIVALISAFLISFSFFLIGKLGAFFPGALGTLVEFLGIDSHLAVLARGVLDTRDLLYFASMTFAFLYLAVWRLRLRRF